MGLITVPDGENMTDAQQKIYKLGWLILQPQTITMLQKALPEAAVGKLDDLLEISGVMELVRTGEYHDGRAVVVWEYPDDVHEEIKRGNL